MRSLPDWFIGSEIIDILKESGDAEYVLDDAEFDAEWRRCAVPVEALKLPATYEEYRAEFCCYGHSEKAFADIERWVEETGGAEAALLQSPPVFSLGKDGIEIIDGHHRIGVAFYKHGLKSIPSVVMDGFAATAPVAAEADAAGLTSPFAR
jgi:hypothetical protein